MYICRHGNKTALITPTPKANKASTMIVTGSGQFLGAGLPEMGPSDLVLQLCCWVCVPCHADYALLPTRNRWDF